MKKTLLALLMAVLPFLATAQTLKDAVDAYNEGAKLFANDKEGAIAQFEKALNICKAVGTEGDSTRMKIEGFLPGLYFDVANTAYTAKKFYEAIEKGKKAEAVATRLNNDTYKDRSGKLLANTYFLLGNNGIRSNQLDSAVHYYNLSLEIDPKSVVWFNLAQAYLRKGDEAKMANAMNKTFELAKTENNADITDKATKVCTQYYYKQAAGQMKNPAKSLEYIDKTLSYDPKFADAYYLKSIVLFQQKKFQESADAATQAIQNETNPDNLGKIYFQLGFAYNSMKKTSDACAAFKKAAEAKAYEAKAKENLKNLKCQ